MTDGPPATAQVAEAEERDREVEDIPFALRLSEWLRKFVDFVGRWGSWFALPMVLFTVIDVIARKISWLDDEGKLHGVQVFLVHTFGRMFESTMLQELEWHFHTALFALVLGYGYIHNSHVRVDLIRENLAFRKQAWLEFLGITLFLLPYTATIVYFSWGYAVTSFEMHEISASTVGLTNRWIIKSVLVFGLIVAGLAGIAVWLQAALVLSHLVQQRPDGKKRYDIYLLTNTYEHSLDNSKCQREFNPESSALTFFAFNLHGPS